jgi:hypothetical protein
MLSKQRRSLQRTAAGVYYKSALPNCGSAIWFMLTKYIIHRITNPWLKGADFLPAFERQISTSNSQRFKPEERGAALQ